MPFGKVLKETRTKRRIALSEFSPVVPTSIAKFEKDAALPSSTTLEIIQSQKSSTISPEKVLYKQLWHLL